VIGRPVIGRAEDSRRGREGFPAACVYLVRRIRTLGDPWVASSGYWQAPFDALQAAGTSVQLAEYLSPDGKPGAYLYAAAVYNRNQADGADVVLLPYDLLVIRNSSGWTTPGGQSIPARDWILGDILGAVGTMPGGHGRR
jgi:hypothetical protein